MISNIIFEVFLFISQDWKKQGLENMKMKGVQMSEAIVSKKMDDIVVTLARSFIFIVIIVAITKLVGGKKGDQR